MADWNAVKAEYISGNGSMRKLAEKHGVPFPTLRDRASREKWSEGKRQVREKVVKETAQKTADLVASNANVAERIRAKLLKKLEREIDLLPDAIGSNTQKATIDNTYDGEKSRRIKQVKEDRKEFNLRDLTTAYKNLTSDMQKQEDQSTLEKLDELLEVAWNAAHE